MTRLERMRDKMDSPMNLNQKASGQVLERRRRVSGPENRKAQKSEERKARDEQFVREFPEMQFNRALGQILDGTAIPENIKHVFDNLHQYEQVVERYETEKQSTVTITIVDFTSPNSKNLS